MFEIDTKKYELTGRIKQLNEDSTFEDSQNDTIASSQPTVILIPNHTSEFYRFLADNGISEDDLKEGLNIFDEDHNHEELATIKAPVWEVARLSFHFPDSDYAEGVYFFIMTENVVLKVQAETEDDVEIEFTLDDSLDDNYTNL